MAPRWPKWSSSSSTANGTYQLTETWRGKGVYALLGRRKAHQPRHCSTRRGRGRANTSTSAAAATRARVDRLDGEHHHPAIQGRDAHRAGASRAHRTGWLSCSRSPSRRRKGERSRSRSSTAEACRAIRIRRTAARSSVRRPGEFDASRLTRSNEGSGEAAEIWLAAELGYLPVRIVVHGEGRHALRADGQAHLASREADARAAGARRQRAVAGSCSFAAPADQLLSRLLPAAPRARPAASAHSSPKRCSRCCGAGARSRRRPDRPRRRRWSPRRCCACSGLSARACRDWSTRTCCARCAKRAADEPAAGGARRSAGLAVAAAGRADTAKKRRCASRRDCSIPRRSTCASISRASSAMRRARSSRRDGIEADADALFAGRPARRRQAGDQPPSRCSAKAWSKCRTRAASFSPGCSRRDAARWSRTTAPAPAARRSRSAMLMRGTGRDLRDGRLGQAPCRARAARGARGHHQCAHARARRGRRARQAPGGQARPRAGRRAVQRLRHLAAQSRISSGATGRTAIAELARSSARILAAAARLVKPGGRLVYATCSILQEENDAVADAFPARAPGIRAAFLRRAARRAAHRARHRRSGCVFGRTSTARTAFLPQRSSGGVM